MAVIYENKQNLTYIPEFLPTGQNNSTSRSFGNLISSNSGSNNQKMNSFEKKVGFNINVIKNSPDHHHHSNKAKSTAIMNRTINGQLCSKSTQKYLDISQAGMLSSFKKSQRSNIVNQNLGSLIFETPPKGKQHRSYLSLKMDDVNRFFEERIEISPTPFKCEQQAPNQTVQNYLSPSKFIISRSNYKN